MALQDRVSHNVRALAAARGYTTTEVARRLHVRSQSISQKLHGKVRWNIEDLEALARVLEVDPATLVDVELRLTVVSERPRQDSNLQPTDLWALAA